MTAVLFRNTVNGVYEVVDSKIASVDAENGGSFDLTGMDLQTGDILCVIPYSPEYTGLISERSYDGKYKSTLKSNVPGNNKVLPEALFGSTQKLRYFNFDYSLSLDGTGDIFYLLPVRMEQKLKTRQKFFMEKNRYVMMESIYRKQFYQ